MTTPPAAVLQAIRAPTVRVTRRVDIYESDGTTPWYRGAPFLGGSVNVDSTRVERRTLDLTISNKSRQFDNSPNKLWYDKVIKPYRGIIFGSQVYETQLGTFMIDQLNEDRFPRAVSITGRDLSKRLMKNKVTRPTAFAAGSTLESVVRGLAASGGIDDMIVPVTGVTIDAEYFVDTGTPRMEAIKTLIEPYGFEAFFNPLGALVMQPCRDPFLSPTIFQFETGKSGLVADWKKSTNDSQLYNHIAVTGSGSSTLPVYAEAINTSANSPTNVDKIGYRTYPYESSIISTEQQAQDLADQYLKIFALEQYDLDLTSAVVPWLEAGEIIRFDEPDGDPADPTRFLLSSFSIPLTLGTMSSTARRVTYVG